MTGGSPVTTGFWYDDTYNRKLSPPKQTDGLGNPGGNCPGTIGTNVAWDEAVDIDLTKLDGGGGLNPNFLVRDPANHCVTLLPHQYLRVNTIFEVVKANGGYTAWTDKHPSYEWTNGPSGKGVDDFYGPEINSIPVAAARNSPDATPVPFPDPTPDDGWTTDLKNIQCYDSLHVQAVINQIDGYTHDRSHKVGVPTVFGTNFQAVSVGEKLKVAGYTDVLGTPSAGLASELDFIDQSIGKFVANSSKQNLQLDADHHRRQARPVADRRHQARRHRRRPTGGHDRSRGRFRYFRRRLADLAHRPVTHFVRRRQLEHADESGGARHSGDFRPPVAPPTNSTFPAAAPATIRALRTSSSRSTLA